MVHFLFHSLKGYRFLIVIAVAWTFAQVGATLLLAFPLKFILDKLVNHRDPHFPFEGLVLGFFDWLDPSLSLRSEECGSTCTCTSRQQLWETTMNRSIIVRPPFAQPEEHICCIEQEAMDIDMIVEAFKLASAFHSRQYKKKSLPDIPKTGHLMEVAGIVQNNGGDEITVAAALLHDAIEDQGAEVRDQIRGKFGQDVLSIIEDCTESETFPRPPWRERKETYLKLVETASLPALLIIVADKLQNIHARLRILKLEGAEGWGNPGCKEKLWYKQSLLKAMRQRLAQLEQETDHPTLVSLRLLMEEFAESVAALTRYEIRMVRSAAHGDPTVSHGGALIGVQHGLHHPSSALTAAPPNGRGRPPASQDTGPQGHCGGAAAR